MRAPDWLNDTIAGFGRSAGVGNFALNERGTAALRFETGAALRIEYTDGELVVAMTVPAADVKRLLALSHPRAPFGFKVRTGILRKTGEAVMAVRFAERDVTLPKLNVAFSLLWRLAGEMGGSAWA